MPRPPTYYFLMYHLMVQGENPDQYIDNALEDANFITHGNYEWGITDLEKININQEQFWFGNLVKTRPLFENRIVDKAARKIASEEIADDLIAHCPFFLHKRRHIIAFHPAATQISILQFQSHFSEIVEQSRGAGFIRFSTDLVTDEVSIFEAINRFPKIYSLKVSLKLPNPNLNPRIKQIRDEMENEGVDEYDQEFNSSTEKGMTINEETRAFDSISMAAAGYGEATLRGYDEEGNPVKASTKKFPVTEVAERIEDSTKEAVLQTIWGKLRGIWNRFDGEDNE